ncbi:MAG: RidA family protein [Acidimicrobiia bacterium]
MKGVIRTERAPAPLGPYSQARVAGGILYVAGQGPLSLEGQVQGETFEDQARATLDNLKAIVEAAGGSLSEVVKVNVYLADMNDWPRFNHVYLEYFQEPFPARTAVQAGLLGIMVEVDAIAHLP